MRRSLLTLMTLGLLVLAAAVPAAASAALAPPWNGEPISPGLGPTYGEAWPVTPPANEAVSALQGDPLAIMPYADIAPVLDMILTEAAAAGVPDRMHYYVIGQSAGGRDMYGAIINALETGQQRRDFQRWQMLRKLEVSNPAQAKKLLASWRGNVKIPIYLEANINGGEYEGTDALMQAVRDLVTTPRGENATVDKFLDHAILIINPCQNPDGRVMGIRGNAAVADTNRDNFLQSQPEEQNSIRLEQQWLETAGLDMHGYVTPTLIDGLTIPHNAAFQYDIFGKWNQLRTAENKADFNAMGYEIQRPVNDWDAEGDACLTGHSTEIGIGTDGATEVGTTVTITATDFRGNPVPHNLSVNDTVIVAGVGGFVGGYNGTFTVTGVPATNQFTYEAAPGLMTPLGDGAFWTAAYGDGLPHGPAYAQSWDDWGPFYGQTYEAFLGVDSSTVEMASTTRLVSKTAQYMAFYSSVDFWVDNRGAMMRDQLEIFRRGVVNAPTDPNAISKVPELVALGFTDAIHNWMVTFPKAYVIPFGSGQRSDAEANRLVEYLLANGIRVDRAKHSFTWAGTAYEAGSYIVSMNQALRGLAWDALAPGTDIEGRISILYASPAAWSHGLLWGADTVEVPRGDMSFSPKTQPVSAPNKLVGGVRGGLYAPADWYAVTLKGVRQDKAILAVLRDGVEGEMAEEPFASTSGGIMPAGSLIFPADSGTAAKLDAAGKQAGMWIERVVGAVEAATSMVNEAPKVAILTTSVPTVTVGPTTYFRGADTDGVLTRLFGADAQYVATTSGPDSLQNAATDPLEGFDVIVNAGANYPSAANATARARLNAFFARGGGYVAQGSSNNNFAFLANAVPALVTGLTQTGQAAYGGIATWLNVGGANSALTGAYPGTDFMFLPGNTTYFSSVPSDAVVDATYPATIATIGPENGYISGMWLDRDPAANSAPVLIHGSTTASSRYVAYTTNPFSRYDAEREWPLVVQAVLWSNLTDE